MGKRRRDNNRVFSVRSKRRSNMGRGVYLLPNILTSASLFSGFFSIISTFKGDYIPASIAILIAILFDGMDGRIARLTHTTSRFGVEYDSLSDLIAFGVAPALLIYLWALVPFGRWGWLAAFLYVICGALRLARFNVSVSNTDIRYFKGLPIPGAAGMIATTILIFHHIGKSEIHKNIIILFLIYILAFLMVSNIKFNSLKSLNIAKQKPFNNLVIVILLFIIVASEPSIMLFIISLAYVISGPLNILITLSRNKTKKLERQQFSANP
jgi:CDP-diacylglycerol--serine O-phosphatidyltransferase